MPGTLMFEGGIQVMAFYLASLGFTLPRDGWRFEPVKDEAFQLQCRSQLVPGARKLVCELYVHGVEGGTTPRLRADMMCSVDGRKAFHGQCIGLELVPAWPLESRQRLLPATSSVDIAREGDFAFDERSMVACAWGRPSDAFGPHYRQFDGARTRTAPARLSLSLYFPHPQCERAPSGDGSRRQGRGGIRGAARRLVFRREQSGHHALPGATGGRVAALRLAGHLYRRRF